MDYLQLTRNLHGYIENAQWNELENLLSDDFVFEGPVPEPLNKERFMEMHRPLVVGFPDLKYNLKDLKADGDRVVGTLAITGTHTGPLDLSPVHGPMLEPTNKAVALARDEFTVWYDGDKIKKIYSIPSEGGGMDALLDQIGAPLPEAN
jgi:predicted ester cyclase